MTKGTHVVYFFILFLIAFDIYVLFFLRINCIIEYLRNDTDDNFVISFYTLEGKFKYKYEIPIVNLGRSGVKFRLVREKGKKEGIESEKRGRLKVTDIFDKYNEFKNFSQTNNDMFCDLRDYIKNRIVLAEFNLKISEGMENASHTGIICGFLWAAAGLLTTFLTNLFKAYNKCVSIKPNYYKKEFTVDLYCIFHLKLVHIIVMILKIRRSTRDS